MLYALQDALRQGLEILQGACWLAMASERCYCVVGLHEK
jgi:hypothetical protein